MTRDPTSCAYWPQATRNAAWIVSKLDLPTSTRATLQDAIERALCDAFEAGAQHDDSDSIVAELAELRKEDFDG